MSRRDRERHEPRGRSNERLDPYSSSRNDGRNSFPRPRHQTSQGWQNGDYYQSNSYNGNYPYQSRSRTSRPSSSYNHNSSWNRQWGGYNPSYQSQWGSSNQQQPHSQSFAPFGQIPQQTHQSLESSKPTGSKAWKPDLDNPPLGSKEHREKTLEESRDRLKKSLEESLNMPSTIFDESTNSETVLQPPVTNTSDCTSVPKVTNNGRSKSRSEIVKTATRPSAETAEEDINLPGTSHKEVRRSSADSNNLATSTHLESASPSLSSSTANRRSRSSSLSSSTNNVSFGISSSAKHTLQSSSTNKGTRTVDVQAEKQRVIKELLSMNRVKLKELVNYPRSRKIDMVMKYMIKESRVQQSHKQRQLAEAGIIGSHNESSNTLAQQDVEALLSDPDLHISLSNLPTEMIETLGNIFKFNSPEDVEETDTNSIVHERHDSLGLNSSETSEPGKPLLNESYSDEVVRRPTDGLKQADYDVCVKGIEDVKPNIRPISSSIKMSDINMSKNVMSSDSTNLDLSLDSLERSINEYEHSTLHSIGHIASPNLEDIFTPSNSVEKSSRPIAEQTFDSTPMEISVDLENQCQLPTVSAIPMTKPSTLLSETGDYFVNNPVKSQNSEDMTCKSVENSDTMTTSIGVDLLRELAEQTEVIDPVEPEIEEALCIAPAFSDQFPVPALLESVEASKSNNVSNGSELVHIASNSGSLLSEHFESNSVSEDNSQVAISVTGTNTVDTPPAAETDADISLSSQQLTLTCQPPMEDDECIVKHLDPADSKNASIILAVSVPSNECAVPLEVTRQGNSASIEEVDVSVHNTCNKIGSLTVSSVDNNVESLIPPLQADLPLQTPEMTPSVVTGLCCPQLLSDADDNTQSIGETTAQPTNETVAESKPTNDTISQPTNETITKPTNGISAQSTNDTIAQSTNETVAQCTSDTTTQLTDETTALPSANSSLVNNVEEVEIAESVYRPDQETNSVVTNTTAEKSIEACPKTIETVERTFTAASEDQNQDKLQHRPTSDVLVPVLNKATSVKSGLQFESVEELELHSTASATVSVEKDNDLLTGVARKTLDPMCILYESANSITLRHASRPLDMAKNVKTCDDVSVSNQVSADMAMNHPSQEKEMTDVSSVQVKSEKEDVSSDMASLQSQMQDHMDELHICRSPVQVTVSEISTQTESSSNAQANVSGILKLLEGSCTHPSQEAALNHLKELFLKTTESEGSSSSGYLRSRQKRLTQQRKPNHSSHNITNKKNLLAPSDSIITQGLEHSNVNTSHDLNFDDRNFQALNIYEDMSEGKISSQEALKSIFYNISIYEKQIENCMEMKKKLYDQVRSILESDNRQTSTSSTQKDMVEVTSSSAEHISTTTSSSVFVPVSQALASRKEAVKNKRKAALCKSKSTSVRPSKSTSVRPSSLPSIASLPSRELRRGLRNVPGNERDKTCAGTSAGSVSNKDCTSHGRIKKEILSTSSSEESPTFNRTRSKQKTSVKLQQKQKLGDKPVSLSELTASSDSCVMTSPSTLKRSSRIKSKCDVKTEKELVTNTKPVLEESEKRYSLRNVEKEVPVVVLSNQIDEHFQNVRTSRKRTEKEIPHEEAQDISTRENSSPKNIRRATRSQGTASTSEECFELCILSPNLSRRTKGERKEILVSPDLQVTQPTVVQSISPRRTTRHSVGETVCQEIISEEVKKPAKRKIQELDNDDKEQSLELLNTKRKIQELDSDDKEQSLELLNTIRRCSVVLEPLSSHVNKKSKSTANNVQHELNVSNIKPTSQVDLDENMDETVNLDENVKSDLDADLTSDEDELPLLTIKQCSQSSNMGFENSIAKYGGDTDQHSISSSDTALEPGADDLETTYSCHYKPKKSKTKKLKKEKQNEHYSKNENLEFIDHQRGTILDLKVIGRHLLAASEDGCLYCYSMKSGKLKRKYEGHQAAVTCLCTIDGEKESEKSCPEKVVTGSLDDYMRCFIFKTAELVHLPLKVGTALCVDQNWGMIYLGTKLGEVAKISTKTFTLVGDHMKFSTESILALKATKEGPRRVLIVGTRDQPVAIRDADTGLFLRTVSGEWHHTVCSLLLDKSFVYCGTMSGPIPVFDFTNGRELFQLHGGVGVRCLKIYNNLLFAGCYDGNIYIYNVKDQSLVQKISASGKMVLCLDVTKNKVIYSCKDVLKSLNFPPEVSKAAKEAKLK